MSDGFLNETERTRSAQTGSRKRGEECTLLNEGMHRTDG